MTEVSTAAPTAASAESPRLDRNWAPHIRAELEAVGCTFSQWPEHMNAEQGEAFLMEFMTQALAHKAVSA